MYFLLLASSGWKKTILSSLAMALYVIFGTTDVHAQQWQYVYGATGTSEEGMRGITPVTGACRAQPSCTSCTTQTDGYIATGMSLQHPSNGDDVYVVRTDNNGAAIWEFNYDISGSGSDDHGESIVELSDGSGFVVTGFTTTNKNTDLFLLKIDCDGTVLWARTYRGPVVAPENSTGVVGHDIIEATTGNSQYGTAAGDLIVAGTVATNEYEDALLLRTNASGTIIWDAIYDESNDSREHFYSLIEATPVSPESTGDIIAVGQWRWANLFQGYVVRVNGNTGAIGTTLQGAATYGNTATNFADFFYSLVELQNPNETGANGQPNVVIVGHGDALNGGAEIFLVKLDDGDPCVPLAQTLVGDGNPTNPQPDMGHDIQEIPFTVTGTSNLARWDLIITGGTSTVSGGPNNDDAFLLGINPATLAPIANTGQVYHPTGTDAIERGWSLQVVDATGGRTQGAVMCGFTTSDWLSAGDPRDIFLLKTNSALSTGLACESNYNPGYVTVQGVDCESPTYGPTLTRYVVEPGTTSQNWGDAVCTNAGNSGKSVPDFNIDEKEAPADLSYLVRINGNPVQSGTELHLQVEGSELPEALEISVTNSSGQQLAETSMHSVDGSGIITLSTLNWPGGVCFITVNDNGYRRTLRAVILN